MRQPFVLIHPARPSHQILLHQACNAMGLFNVRVTHDLADLDSCLARPPRADLLILEHAVNDGLALLERAGRTRAVLFVGHANAGSPNLAHEARRQGLWVLADLPWPLPVRRWQRALQRIQTVTSPTHPH
ncbi:MULTISPECIES: histidine kinase [Pseudomonas]|uniref:Histidine kinase n=1 Tax=Pseudomonas vlassakiae TaxID=485888 RepID=A0A923GJV1_9PSED|nr:MULTISPECIES: histidine kinase [Pseudomonas]MBH3413310.1 histidine kinase [Pseudomonas putida]MBV4541020.1 histidine kinase [Pseudomonas vlassakiae]